MRSKNCYYFVIAIIFLIVGLGFLSVTLPYFLDESHYYMTTASYIQLGIGVVSTIISVYCFIAVLITSQRWNKVVGIVKSHERITVDEVSKKTRFSGEKVQDIIYSAIREGELQGTLEGGVFIRKTGMPAASSTVVEREVMITRRVPETCFKCGASIKPDEVSWLGPDNVECPHCGASLKVTTERV